MSGKPTAIVYVDGFNLYRRLLANNDSLKWLDLYSLFQSKLPQLEVLRIEYFTANLKPNTVDDPQSVVRQQIYLRALKTDSRIRIHLGQFRVDKRFMSTIPPTIHPVSGKAVLVPVRKIEEKGSDVNLATRMVADALTNKCDVVVLVTNDSDHAGQARMLIEEFSKRVGLITPVQESKRSSKQLKQLRLEFHKELTVSELQDSQLPEILSDSIGRFRRPKKWA